MHFVERGGDSVEHPVSSKISQNLLVEPAEGGVSSGEVIEAPLGLLQSRIRQWGKQIGGDASRRMYRNRALPLRHGWQRNGSPDRAGGRNEVRDPAHGKPG